MDEHKGIDMEKLQSAFNLNQLNFILISDLQRQAFTLANKGFLNDSFNRWQSIRLIVEPRFRKDEREKLDKLENGFLCGLKINIPDYLNPNLESDSTKKFHIEKKIDSYKRTAWQKAKREKLNKYVKGIMDLMRIYGLSLTDKEKKIKLT